MKSYKFILAFLVFIMISCKNEKNEIIDKYLTHSEKKISETIFDYSILKEQNKAYLDSLISKTEFKDNSKIISEIYNDEKIKTVDSLAKQKVKTNIINKISHKDVFFSSNVTNIWSVYRAEFTKSNLNITETQINLNGPARQLRNHSSKYTIKIDDEGLVVMECKISDDDVIIEFNKNEEGDYYIDFKDKRLWMKKNEVQKEIQKEKDESHNDEFKSDMSPEEQAEQGGPIGETVIGIKDKIYFYNESNYESKTKSYFVKGQKAEYFDVSDDNTEDEFLYVNFEFNGKVKAGYVLKSDVQFE